MKKKNDSIATTEYMDGFQYSEDTANFDLAGQNLKFFTTSEGYFDFTNNRYIYHYNDHLGNVRLSFVRAGSAAVILEKNDYYAFGLKHGNPTIDLSSVNYKYQYNGKELQQEIGMYDYGARFYMPDLGRWGVVDPMAEATPHLSPYHYANNNPLMYNDPTGMLSQSFMDEVWGSPSGTMWTNNGNGFTNNWGGMMDNDGNAQNYNSYSLAAQHDYITGGGSGGGQIDMLGFGQLNFNMFKYIEYSDKSLTTWAKEIFAGVKGASDLKVKTGKAPNGRIYKDGQIYKKDKFGNFTEHEWAVQEGNKIYISQYTHSKGMQWLYLVMYQS